MKKILSICLTIVFVFYLTLTLQNAKGSVSENVFYKYVNSFECGDRTKKKIYLTFDDGYPTINTVKIIEILIEKNIPATIFIEGETLKEIDKDVINKAINNNIIIGCHTIDHEDITTKSNAQFLKDLNEYEELYFNITKTEITRFFRPPMGKINSQKQKILFDKNYVIFFWDVCYYDYNINYELGKEYVINYLNKNVKNGSIILMHTLTISNVEALPIVIDNLINQGYVFSSLTDFYNLL